MICPECAAGVSQSLKRSNFSIPSRSARIAIPRVPQRRTLSQFPLKKNQH
jgi:hypothetical protein